MFRSEPNVTVRKLSDADKTRWDRFVFESPKGTFFHLSGWQQVIRSAFGCETFYLLSERCGEITGVLPLTYIRSPIFGKRLVSNAFAMYGGPVATDTESRSALEAEAEQLMASLPASALEFRTIEPIRSDWATRSDVYVTFRKELLSSIEANLKAIPSGQRTIIKNRAARNRLVSEVDTDTRRFYPIYAESVRNLGTPVFSKKYFNTLLETFGGACDIVTILHGDEPVASSLNTYFRDEVMTLYVGGTAGARALGANVFMFWEVMRRSCERGFRTFDFGRSKVGTGAYTFKRNWGFDPMPLHYQTKVRMGQSVPDLNPLNPKYKFLIAAWKRLPLPIANLIGPRIVKGLG